MLGMWIIAYKFWTISHLFCFVDSTDYIAGSSQGSRSVQVLLAHLTCLGIPLGLWLTFWYKWQLAGLWTGLAASTAYSFLVAVVLLIRSDWSLSLLHDQHASAANEANTLSEDEE